MAAISTADFLAKLATARTTYSNAVTALVNAMIDLEALTRVVNSVDPNADAANTMFGANSTGHWPDLHDALSHPIAAPHRSHPSLKGMNLDRDIRTARQNYYAQWSGS